MTQSHLEVFAMQQGLTLEQATGLLLERAKAPAQPETVPLLDGFGRVSFKDVRATLDHPRLIAPRSMDTPFSMKILLMPPPQPLLRSKSISAFLLGVFSHKRCNQGRPHWS